MTFAACAAPVRSERGIASRNSQTAGGKIHSAAVILIGLSRLKVYTVSNRTRMAPARPLAAVN